MTFYAICKEISFEIVLQNENIGSENEPLNFCCKEKSTLTPMDSCDQLVTTCLLQASFLGVGDPPAPSQDGYSGRFIVMTICSTFLGLPCLARPPKSSGHSVSTGLPITHQL